MDQETPVIPVPLPKSENLEPPISNNNELVDQETPVIPVPLPRKRQVAFFIPPQRKLTRQLPNEEKSPKFSKLNRPQISNNMKHTEWEKKNDLSAKQHIGENNIDEIDNQNQKSNSFYDNFSIQFIADNTCLICDHESESPNEATKHVKENHSEIIQNEIHDIEDENGNSHNDSEIINNNKDDFETNSTGTSVFVR